MNLTVGGDEVGGTTRVAIVLSDGLGARGGIGRIVGYLVRAIGKRAPDLDLRVYRARLTERAVLKHLSVPLSLSAFTARVRKSQVVHINVAPRGSTWRKRLYARVAQRLGIPVLLHLHGSGYDEFYRGLSADRQAKVRQFFGSADAVVALSPYWRDFIVQDLRVPAERVTTIANGVPAADPAAGPRPVTDVPNIVFLGALGTRKGTDVLIAALAELSRRKINWRATLGGNGDVEPMRALAIDAGIADRIDFPGWVDEAAVDRLMRAADIFVLPSRAENQPVAILEAMARELPVVATAIGAIPDQVEHGRTGLLVPPGEVMALADALAKLAADATLRAQMGRAGLERFASHFSIDACADQFAKLYRTLAQKARR